MQSLLSLLVRHALMLCSGWFAANGIDGSNTVGIVTGLLILGVVTAWSLAEKWLNLKPGQLTDSIMLRTIVGSLASQIVTGLSAYFAVDANQPELLGVAVLNAGLSKVGVHQRLAGVKAAQILIASLALLSLPSCSSFSKEDAKAAGAQIGLAAADAAILIARMQLSQAEAELATAATQPDADQRVILAKQLGVIAARKALDEAEKAIAKQRAKTSAKNPVTVWRGDDSSPVQLAQIYPTRQCSSGTTQSRPHPARAVKVMASAPHLHTETSREGRLSKAQVSTPHLSNGDDSSPLHQQPACLRRIAVPDYGTRVAAHLASN